MEKKRVGLFIVFILLLSTPALAFSFGDFFKSLFGFQNEPQLSPPNVVLDIPFNGDFLDVSGNNNHAYCTAPNCPTFVPGLGGDGGYSFDIDDFLLINQSSSIDFSGAFSFELWLTMPSTLSNDQVIFGKMWNDATFVDPYYQYGLEYNHWDGSPPPDQEFIFLITDSTGSTSTNPKTVGTVEAIYPAQPSTRYYIVGTYGENLSKIYLNGIWQDSVNNTLGIGQRNSRLRIGSDSANGQHFTGSIDNFRLWDRELTSQEINDTWNNLSTIPPQYSNKIESPLSPTPYVPNRLYQFNITWIDTNLDKVWLESDLSSPSIINQTISPVSGGLYSYSVFNLTPKNYKYRWCANDTLGGVNCTSNTLIGAGTTYTYSVTNGNPTVSTKVNGINVVNTTQLNPGTHNLTFEGTGDTISGVFTSVFCSANPGTCPFVFVSGVPSPYSNVGNYPAGNYNISWSFDPTDSSFNTINGVLSLIVTADPFPSYSNILNTPSSPTTFSPSQNYAFSIDWTDNNGIDKVWIEHSFDGVFINTTVPLASGNTYTYNHGPLASNSFYPYTWYANDTNGNINKTTFAFYQVNPAQPSVNLLLNSIDGNLVISQGQTVNITGQLVSGGDEPKTIRLLNNQSLLINQGSNIISNLTTFNLPGSYTYTVQYPSTQNYSQNVEQHTITVNADTQSPIYSNLIPVTNPISVNYTPGNPIYDFRVDWTDNVQLDSVWIEHNFNGVTVIEQPTSNLGSTYTYSKNNLPVGNYIYNWFANDTNGNINSTGPRLFSVNMIPTKVNLTLNGNRNNISLITGSSVDVVGSLEEGEGNTLQIRDGAWPGFGSILTQGTSPVLHNVVLNSPGVYTFSTVSVGSQNYSANYETFFVTISNDPAPFYSNLQVSPNSPTTFSPSQNYQFNVTWQDNNGIDSVWMVHNFGGSNQTTFSSIISGDSLNGIYTEIFAVIPAGNHTYYWYANDTNGNVVTTGPIGYTINKATPIITKTINGIPVVTSYNMVEGNMNLRLDKSNPTQPSTGTFALNKFPDVNLVNINPPLSHSETLIPGNYSYTWTFTPGPSDINNYNIVNGQIDIEALQSNQQITTLNLNSLDTFTLPLLLPDYSISGIFGSELSKVNSIYSYDPLTGWEVYHADPRIPDTLATLEPKKGYFVVTTSPIVLNLNGTLINSTGGIPQIDLEQGWNLIGLHGINSQPIQTTLDNANLDYTFVYSFNNTIWNYTQLNTGTDNFEVGEAYWVYLGTQGQYSPDAPPSFFEILRKILLK